MSAAYLKAAACGIMLICSACVVVPTPAATPVAAGPVAGTVTPTRPPQAGYCREYQQTVMIGGQMQTAHGTSCLQADGTWKLAGMPVDRSPPPPAAPSYSYVPYSGPYVVVPIGPATTEANDRGK